MAIVRWDPFRELTTLQDRMNRLFGDVDGRQGDEGLLSGARLDWMPAVDIYENGNHELVLKAELPDMKREDIDLRVENNTLTLRGERKVDQEVKEEQYHRIERSHGAFTRSFSLPATVDSAKISAEYKSGVLTVKLPMREDAKPKQIEVRVN